MNAGANDVVSVLAVLPSREDRASLNKIFQLSQWQLHYVDGLGLARPLLDSLTAGVVISDSHFSDGSWQDLLCDLQRRKIEPLLIVASRLADEGLWAEVLHRGGYDVLATPFQAQEVTHAVGMAWRHWRDKLELTGHPAPRVLTAGF